MEIYLKDWSQSTSTPFTTKHVFNKVVMWKVLTLLRYKDSIDTVTSKHCFNKVFLWKVSILTGCKGSIDTFHKTMWKVSILPRYKGSIVTFRTKLLKLTLKAPITSAADDKFLRHFSKFSIRIRYDITWESSASRRFSWNIMPYWLFLKKRQNLKLSSAANYRWRFKG